MVAGLIWWLGVQVVGLLALPLTFRVFAGLPDRGYPLARSLGLLLAGFLFWFAGSMGILRNDLGGVLAALLLVAGISLYAGRRELGLGGEGDQKGALWRYLREHKWLVLFTEGLFLVSFALWTWYRSYSPEIATTGGEKFMEFAFINGILRSPQLPPADPWLSGFAISYYYFGYLILTMLIRLTGIAAGVAFNLSLALLFALTVVGTFSLVYNLIRLSQAHSGTGSRTTAAGFGLLGSLFLAILGNLHAFLEWLHSRGIGGPAFWGWLDIRDLEGPAVIGAFPPERFLWWWRASRVLQDRDLAGNPIEIINEFPFFSFMLGDVHPHVLALPFVLLALALGLNLLTPRGEEIFLALKRPSPTLLLYAVCLGALAFLNTWDLPTYLGIVLVAFVIRSYVSRSETGRSWIVQSGMTSGMLAGLSLLLYVPFYIGFQSQAGGPALALWAKTHLPHYVVMFGTFLFVIAFFLGVSLQGTFGPFSRLLRQRDAQAMAGVSLLLLLLCIVTGRWTGLLIGILILCALWAGWKYIQQREVATLQVSPIFALLLLTVGLSLTLVVEFVYLRDMFNTRMNTIFKFYYQAWTLMAVAAGFGVYYVRKRLRPFGRYLFASGLTVLVAAGMLYPLFAAPVRADNFSRRPTLDGTAYVAQSWPEEYAAIKWVSQNIEGPAVILEASGGSYTFYGRVSAFTGTPTLLGWAFHQLQWRGNYDEPGRREPHIEQLYRTTNLTEAETLLEAYGVTHVYVGRLEREKFRLSNPMIDKFGLFMDLVYDENGVKIYRRRGV